MDLIGTSVRMAELRQTIAKVARTDANVLIQGESGTGKELVARAIHAMSGRVSRPFVDVKCGALNENLLHSELFGHEKGSFTGAEICKPEFLSRHRAEHSFSTKSENSAYRFNRRCFVCFRNGS